MVQPRRGEIWLINLNPTRRDEIAKTRPAVVISSDAVGILAVKTVVPLTSWRDRFGYNPWMIRIEPNGTNGLTNVSATDALPIRGLSTERCIKKLGVIASDVMDEIAATVAIVIEHK